MGLSKPQYESYQTISTLGPSHAIAKYSGYPVSFPVMFPHVPDPDLTLTDATVKAKTLKYLEKYKIPDPMVPPIRPQPQPLILKDEERMLRIIHENPMLSVTEMYGIFGGNPKDANVIKARLLKKGYVAQESVKVKKKVRANVFMRLTPDACQQLKLKPRAESKPGIKHEIYCRLVRLKLEDEGWNCEFEGMVKPHNHPMDVLASKNTGLDIIRHDYEITTSIDNIKDNIENALDNKLAQKVIIVADDIEKCRNKTTDEQKKYGDALEFKPISDFYF